MINDILTYSGKGKIKEILQFRIKENKDLLETINKAVVENQIRSAIIISGVGALSKAVLRNLKWFPKEYPVRNNDRLFYQIEKPLELLTLSGFRRTEIPKHLSYSQIDFITFSLLVRTQ